ncbi:MAG: hypothetical protein ACI959_000422 [Limisphaerales bacterium]
MSNESGASAFIKMGSHKSSDAEPIAQELINPGTKKAAVVPLPRKSRKVLLLILADISGGFAANIKGDYSILPIATTIAIRIGIVRNKTQTIKVNAFAIGLIS